MFDLILLILLGVVALWNVVVYVMYAVDKRRAAKNAWRISEARLIGSALCAGGIGAALAMHLLRHKTQHTNFKILVPVGAVITIVVVGALVWFRFIA